MKTGFYNEVEKVRNGKKKKVVYNNSSTERRLFFFLLERQMKPKESLSREEANTEEKPEDAS